MTTSPLDPPTTHLPSRAARRAFPAGRLLGRDVVSASPLASPPRGATPPRYFPDEYIYPAVARSLADGDGSDGPRHAGPLPGAPRAAAHCTDLARRTTPRWPYRLTQALHVVAMSLAAIPVYSLARRVGVAHWQAVGCAAFTVALPSLLFTSYMTADAVAYPLALGAIALGVAAIDRPTGHNQVAFVALAGLATFARVQYVVVPVAFVVAALVLERGRRDPCRAPISLDAVVSTRRPVARGSVAGPRGPRVLPRHPRVRRSRPALSPIGSPSTRCCSPTPAASRIVPGAVAGARTGAQASRATALTGRSRRSRRALSPAPGREAALYAANGSRALPGAVPDRDCPPTRGGVLRRGRAGSRRAAVRGSRRDGSVRALAPHPARRLHRARRQAGLAVPDGRRALRGAWRRWRLARGGGRHRIPRRSSPSPRRSGRGLRIPWPSALRSSRLRLPLVGATSYDLREARMEFTYSADGNWTWIDDLHLGHGLVLVTPGADRATAESTPLLEPGLDERAAHATAHRQLDAVRRRADDYRARTAD